MEEVTLGLEPGVWAVVNGGHGIICRKWEAQMKSGVGGHLACGQCRNGQCRRDLTWEVTRQAWATLGLSPCSMFLCVPL